MSAEDLRLEGNALFAERDFSGAVAAYSKAISIDGESSILLSNRSAAYIGLESYEEARADAERALQLDGAAIKAHYRLAVALRGLRDTNGALLAAKRGLTMDPTNKALTALAKELVAAIAPPLRPSESGPSRHGKGPDDVISSELSRMLQVVDSGSSASSRAAALAELQRHAAVMLGGVYKKLVESRGFVETLYPGVAIRDLAQAPKDIFELLRRGSAVRNAVESQMGDIRLSALSILEGVRKKGAAKGDTMESGTEGALCKQIAGEALARSVVSTVRALNRHASAAFSELWADEAKPENAGEGDLELLDESVLAELFGNKRICIQDEFLGVDWSLLVASDLERFRRTQPMTPMETRVGAGGTATSTAESPLIAWIDPPSTAGLGSKEVASALELFPALAEAIRCLHALPFVCNAYLLRHEVGGNRGHYRLPCRGATAVTYIPAGAAARPLVIDNGGGENDFGIRLSCNLVIIPDAATGACSFQYRNASDISTLETIPMINDRLFVHQSSEVLTGRSAGISVGFFVLSFYIHGPKIS